MKTLITIFVLIATRIQLQAGDFYFVSAHPTNLQPATVTVIDFSDRTGDRRDYIKSGLPVPAQFPAIVDTTTGDMAVQPVSIAAGKATIRAMQSSAVTNETPKFFEMFTLSTNSMALIGTNRTGYALVRYDGTKLTAAQRETYQTECIQYLSARLQLLERALKQKGVVNIKSLAEGDTP